MVKSDWEDDRILFTPTNLYMEYVLLSYHNFLKENMDDFSITPGELTYIYNIKYFGSISQSDLANKLYVSQANIAKMIKKLEGKGFVKREIDSKNKSRKILSLTAAGEDIFIKVHLLTSQWERDITKKLPNDDLIKFKKVLYLLTQESANL